MQTRHIAAMYTDPLIEDVERDFAAPASDSDCITLSSAKTDMFDIKTTTYQPWIDENSF